MRRLTLTATAFAATAVLALAGCGDDDDDDGGQPAGGGGGAAQSLEVTADPGGALKFDKTELSAKAGSVTITMPNPSDVPHAIAIRGGVEATGETVQKDGTSTVTADVQAGSYEFYCPVGNHADAGMKGTLTVQ